MELSAYLFALVFICASTAAIVFAIRSSRRSGDRPGSDGGGEGGPKVPRAPAPQPGPPDTGEPAWWPEFERELADYTARVRGRRQSVGRRAIDV